MFNLLFLWVLEVFTTGMLKVDHFGSLCNLLKQNCSCRTTAPESRKAGAAMTDICVRMAA